MSGSTLDEDRLSETFAALANATRRAILERLAEGPATVNDLATPFDLSLPAISRHLKVLEQAGLVERGRRAQFRPCALDPAPLAEVSAWAEYQRHAWNERLDRMDDYLSTSTEEHPDPMTDDTTQSVVLERHLAAPPARVWEMWTRPEHFQAWYGPTGATIPVAEMDVRVGGARFVGMEMQTPDGPMRMWFVGEYRVVESPVRLVYTEALADEDGNVLDAEAAGMPAGHPTTTEVVVELAAAGDGTTLVLTHRGIPADSPGATGWGMALDALGDHLAGQG